MQQNNTFTLRENRFTQRVKTTTKSYTCIQYKKYFKSIKNEQEMFTNFVSSLASKKYKELKLIYNSFNIKEDVLGKKFIADELQVNNSKTSRLLNIIHQNTEKVIEKNELSKILKFKNIEDSEIQLYFYSENGVLNLYLVDIYHLGIVAKKEGRYMWKDKYKSKQNCKQDIAEIKEST